jgi:hypothetical protein
MKPTSKALAGFKAFDAFIAAQQSPRAMSHAGLPHANTVSAPPLRL